MRRGKRHHPACLDAHHPHKADGVQTVRRDCRRGVPTIALTPSTEGASFDSPGCNPGLSLRRAEEF
jgi:hypothetical protein